MTYEMSRLVALVARFLETSVGAFTRDLEGWRKPRSVNYSSNGRVEEVVSKLTCPTD